MDTETSDNYSFSLERASAPSYGGTHSFEKNSVGQGSEKPQQQPAQPEARWKYHNLDSSLLEFLALIAENEVPVARMEDVTFSGTDFGHGTSMQVTSGLWLNRPVAVKRSKQLLFQPGYGLEDPKSLKDRIRIFEKRLKDLMFEIRIMKHPQLAKHPNIVELIGVAFEDGLRAPERSSEELREGSLGYTTEIFWPILLVEPALQESADLAKYFLLHEREGIPAEISVSLICDIAAGLAALHELGIVHGDLKDENVLLFPSNLEAKPVVAKLADFGAAGIDASREDVRGQSHYWAAPEAIERPAGWEGLRHTPATDVYSFGLLAATIALAGHPIFKVVDSYSTKMEDEVIRHVKNLLDGSIGKSCGRTTLVEHTHFIESMKRLIGATVGLDPQTRLRDISVVPAFFGKSCTRHNLAANGGILPFHSYGTLAHPGVPMLASRVADEIYDKLPNSFHHRLADMIRNFADASTDSQTMLVHIALKMANPSPAQTIPEDMVRLLLAIRLAAEEPPETQVPPEADVGTVGGFMQMYAQEIILGGREEPPVLRAVRENNRAELERLLTQDGEQRRAKVGAGWNGLHYAAFFNRPDLMELFLQGGNPVPINAAVDQAHRYTPLHTAAWQANPSCVKILLDHGADKDAKSMATGEFSMTALQLCILEALDLSRRNVCETVKILLKNDAAIDFRFRGLGVTHYLAQHRGSAEALRLILEYRPDFVDQMTPNCQRPLHSAVGVRNKPVVELLLALGADVHAKNIMGDTALHNAYMSIGPASRPTSKRYSIEFVRGLVGDEEDAKSIIQLLLNAGADPDALGLDYIPWDTPEFRMYDEYEDVSEFCISPWQRMSGDDTGPPSPQWSFFEWPRSDFGHVAVFERGDAKMELAYELGEVTPNYYEVQIRLACLDIQVQSMSVTVLIYRLVDDTAEVFMAARLALHRLDVKRTFEAKMRDFVVKHKTDLKFKIYEEATPGRDVTGPRQGRVMIDWLRITKFNPMTVVGSSTSAPLENFPVPSAGDGSIST